MPNPLTEVVMAAALLKAGQPQHFQQLCEALRSYEAQSIVSLIAADMDADIHRAQGKVRAIQELRKHIAESSELRARFSKEQ